MDTKNIIAAISLSAAVIILYGLFFAPEPQPIDQKKILQEKNQVVQNSETPSLEQNEEILKISRKDALKESKRIDFENENIKGTISMVGGIIDDLTFKKYTETLDGNDQIVLLNPKNLNNGYYVDTGWVTSSENIFTLYLWQQIFCYMMQLMFLLEKIRSNI